MAAHVHQRAAAGLIEVIEPVAVRSRVLFALTHVVDRSDGAFADELANAFVFRREAQFLGIHQLSVVHLARGDHRVGLFEREAQRLFKDHVFAGGGRRNRDARMKVIRQADVRDVVIGTREAFLEIGRPACDSVPLGQCSRAAFGSRVDGHHFGVGHEAMVRLGMDVGDEPGAEQGDSGFAHGVVSTEGTENTGQDQHGGTEARRLQVVS